jgi:hypothetical protein
LFSLFLKLVKSKLELLPLVSWYNISGRAKNL